MLGRLPRRATKSAIFFLAASDWAGCANAGSRFSAARTVGDAMESNAFIVQFPLSFAAPALPSDSRAAAP